MKIRDTNNEAQPLLVSRDDDGPSSVQDIGLSSRRRLIRGQGVLKTTGQGGGNVVPDAGFKITGTPPTKRPKNVVRRALHKIMKRRRHKQSAPPVVFDIEPPKLEELDIEPRLREKYEKMREQKRQAAASGKHNQLESRGMATLVVNGLSTGSVQWLRGKTRHWLESNRFTVAMTIAAVGLAILCAIIWRRCS